MLIKKTLTLSGNAGEATFFRFGNTLGAKWKTAKPVKGVLGLSANGARRFYFVEREREELDFDLPFTSADSLGAVLYDEKGKRIASAGNFERAEFERDFAAWVAASVPLAQSEAESYAPDPKPQETPSALPALAEENREMGSEISCDSIVKNTPLSPQECAGTETCAEQNEEESSETEADAIAQTEVEGNEEVSTETENRTEQNEQREKNEATTDEVVPEEKKEEARVQERKRVQEGLPFELELGDDFYPSVRARLEETLIVNPSEQALEQAIPESRWVKIYYEGEDYYVVGEVREEGEPKLIGYGVPGVREIEPPEEVRALSDFLPIEGEQGYWLLFQSVEDGKLLPTES